MKHRLDKIKTESKDMLDEADQIMNSKAAFTKSDQVHKQAWNESEESDYPIANLEKTDDRRKRLLEGRRALIMDIISPKDSPK